MLLELLSFNPYFWLLCLVGLLLYYNYSRRKLYWLSWQLPGRNPALPIIGNLPQLIGSPVSQFLSFLEKEAAKYKSGIFRVWLGQTLCVVVNDPSVAYQINQKTQLKSNEYQFLAKPYIERGLFITNDMPYWRQSKKAYLTGLSSENLRCFIPIFQQEGFRVLDTFRKHAINQESVYTPKIFGMYAFGCIGKCALDFDIHTEDEARNENLMKCIEGCLEIFQKRLLIPVLRNEFIFALSGLRAKEREYIKCCAAYIKRMMDSYENRKQTNMKIVAKESFIECLMGDELKLSDEDIEANMITMVVAGTDTLVTEYTMLLILLAQNPHVQEKVYEELIHVLGHDVHICPSTEELNKLEYLDRVLKEVLRMFPAAPVIGRQVSEDFTVVSHDKKYNIPVGTTISILIRNILNNTDYYETPDVMDPDRWLPENVAKRPPFCYLPFNNGPRNCPGGRYALLQMKTMMAMVVRAFEIRTSKTCEKFEDIRIEMNMTVKIGSDCQVMFKERRNPYE